MRLTTKGRFAVTAMIDLAMRDGQGPVTLAEISQRQKISLSYLEQLFGKLRRQSLVNSTRGPGGGYTRARRAEDMSVADIILAVDEPIDATQCGGMENCQDEQKCLTHDLWSALNTHIFDYLKDVKLYVRVTDATTGATYAVFPIGPVVSFNKPQTLVDRLGQLHLLHQFGMRAYASHVISPDGVILERRTYDITDSRPALRMNDQGEVIVLGGVRRPDASDIPALTATNAPPKEIPAPASAPRP